MTVTNIRNRLDRLEAHYGKDFVVIQRYHTETVEQAKARWQAENPGKDLERIGLKVIIIEWADPVTREHYD